MPLGFEHGVAVTAVGLGPVHRGVRGLHQLCGSSAAVATLHDPDTRRDNDLTSVRQRGTVDGVQGGLRDGAQSLGPRVVFDEDHELVTAHLSHQLAVPAQVRYQPMRQHP